MATAARRTNREMVEHWRRAGPELERIRRWELENYRHEDHVDVIDALLDLADSRTPTRTTSGLVELQRILAKARR